MCKQKYIKLNLYFINIVKERRGRFVWPHSVDEAHKMEDGKMKQIILGITICFFGLVSGCATITTGTGQSVTVVTEKNVEDAKCELTDVKGGRWYIPETPSTVSVDKGNGPMSVVCDKEGYNTATLMVEETIAGATFGNLLIGGGVGIIIDAMSGSAQRYPDQIVVWMEPKEWGSEDERSKWIKEKEAYEAELAAKQKALQEKETQAPFGN